MKRLGICVALLLGLHASACSEEPDVEVPDEPDRPSPTETISTEDLRAQIEEVESTCDLLEAEMIKERLLQEEYEEPRRIGTTTVCNTSARRDCADSSAGINLYIYPEDSNVEAAERLHDRTLPEDLIAEGYVGKSGDTEAYAVAYSGGYVHGYGRDSYETGVYILGEFYFIRAELYLPGDECMPSLDELGPWMFEEYAPAVVESVESELDR